MWKLIPLILLLLSSCQNEIVKEEHIHTVRITFSSVPEETKTYWDGESIMWSAGDRICATYYCNGTFANAWYESDALTRPVDRASFNVSMPAPAEEDGATFFAVYPHSCVTGNFSNAPYVGITIPAKQTVSDNSFDKSSDIMLGHSLSGFERLSSGEIPLLWNRLVAHADFTLSSIGMQEGETVRRLVLNTGAEEHISGDIVANLKSGEWKIQNGLNEIELDLSLVTTSDDKLNVWASLLPIKVKSLIVRLYTSEAVYERRIPSCNIEFKANMRNILEVDMSSATRTPLEDASLVISTHPRLFIRPEDIPAIRENAAGDARQYYDAMKQRVDKLMAEGISFEDPLAASGEYNTNHEIGFRASDAAMVWLISEDETYLQYAKTILSAATEYYQLRVSNNLNIAWYIYSQVCALCAYDWLYNDLTKEERISMGTALYNVMYDIAWHGDGIRSARYRENISDHTSGVYGITALPWYISLAFSSDGINDGTCSEMFRSGYEFHRKMIAYRREMAGTNGGGATACPVYSFGFYPLADFNFIRTYKSATGIDISEELDYVLKYANYINWSSLPDERKGSAKEFGFGDANHFYCRMPYQDINYHLCEIASLYGEKHPEILSEMDGMLSRFCVGRDVDRFAFIRLLQKRRPELSPAIATKEKVKYFDTMGQIIMRSGTGDNDTYTLFTCGGRATNHKHYDNNNFVIYRNGYRSLDSGSRPEPGQHLSHYYSRTVAHNCVTIRMPGETFPSYWGSAAPGEEVLPVPNDGGQNQLLASELKILKETNDYVYLASDATDSYNQQKVSLVMREFIWCVPDLFVVFDRVKSTDASYPKSWLYHTASEPSVNGKEFSETSQGGKSICRVLLPTDARLTKIGGPGMQFWSDGRNWPIPSSKSDAVPDNDWPLVGQWRMEVAPGDERTDDFFLNMIQVGDESLSSLPRTELQETASEIDLTFDYNGKSFSIRFDKNASQDYGCLINVTQ